MQRGGGEAVRVITRAVLRGEPAGDPGARVAGLPVLLRQLLSLQDAGIAVVELAGAAAVAADPRLTLRLVESAGAAASPGGEPSPPALTARPGLVWHPGLPRRLAAGAASADLERVPLLPGEFVLPAATSAERDRAERLLFGTLFKPTDGMISRAINRRLSLRVTRVLLGTAVTPNQVTLVAAAIGLAGVGAIFAWGAPALLPGALLVQTQSVLDGCDGEMSRLTYRRSRLGEWLDQVFDDLVNLGHFAAVGWTLFLAGSQFAGWLTAAGVVGHLAYQAALYPALLTRGGGSGSTASLRWWGQAAPGAAAAPRPATPLGRLRTFVELAGRRDFFTFLYVPAALCGASVVALAWAAVIFTASGVTTCLQWLVGGGPEHA